MIQSLWGVQEETDSGKTGTELFLKETESESRRQRWALSPRGLGTTKVHQWGAGSLSLIHL